MIRGTLTLWRTVAIEGVVAGEFAAKLWIAIGGNPIRKEHLCGAMADTIYVWNVP